MKNYKRLVNDKENLSRMRLKSARVAGGTIFAVDTPSPNLLGNSGRVEVALIGTLPN